MCLKGTRGSDKSESENGQRLQPARTNESPQEAMPSHKAHTLSQHCCTPPASALKPLPCFTWQPRRACRTPRASHLSSTPLPLLHRQPPLQQQAAAAQKQTGRNPGAPSCYSCCRRCQSSRAEQPRGQRRQRRQHQWLPMAVQVRPTEAPLGQALQPCAACRPCRRSPPHLHSSYAASAACLPQLPALLLQCLLPWCQ